MIAPFTYDVVPGRVVFGVGSRHTLADELELLGTRRALVVASIEEDAIAEELSDAVGERIAGRFTDVAQHVPVAKAAAAVALAEEVDADTIITIGGGSATGFGKAIALEREVKLLSVATTYAGSEMTTIWGLTDGDHKQTGKSPRVKPTTVIYDPELTLSLPLAIAGPSGMNAMAHSIEALYGPGANPIIEAIALESVRALHQGLPRIAARPDDIEGRTDVLYGAYLAGVALATGGTALHHKTCHVLGGMFGLNHGEMNAVVLGHALAYNSPAIPELMAKIGTALGTSADESPRALFDLASTIDAPTSLEAIGMPVDGIDEAAQRVVTEAAANVRAPDEEGIQRMLDAAFHGKAPAA